MQKLPSLIALACLLASLVLQPVARAQGAADCEPTLEPTDLQGFVQPRNRAGLVNYLRAQVKASDAFREAVGTGGLHAAIDTLANEVMNRDPADVDFAALAERLRLGMLEACVQLAQGASDDEAAKKAVRAARLSGGDSQYFALLGTANSLEGDGNFSSGLEASLMSVTHYPIAKLPILRNWTNDSEKLLTGTFEITFSEIGNIDDEAGDMPDPTNPFAAGGGFFRLNTSGDIYFSGGNQVSGLGARVGGGFSTLPSEAEGDVDTRGRGYAGLVFRANYGKDPLGRQGKGEVFLGWAKDKFWRYDRVVDDTTMPPTLETVDETDRLIVDARMDVPQVFESEDVRIHARVFADIPASGNGPSDIRISLLLTVNLGAFFPVN